MLIAVITIGIPGCGKSTWAAQHPELTEVNLDLCREKICGDAGNQTVTPQAVVLHRHLIKQAAKSRLDLVVSDTNIHPVHRKQLISDLRSLGYNIKIIYFDVPPEVCIERNKLRDKQVPEHVIHRMHSQMPNYADVRAEVDELISVEAWCTPKEPEDELVSVRYPKIRSER